MGQSSSKPSPEVKTFIPQTPVEFSSSLLAQLDNSTEVSFKFLSPQPRRSNSIATSEIQLKSDYTRSQYAETYIQQRISDELSKLNKQALESLDKSLESATSEKEIDSIKSTTIANEKLESINKKLIELNETKPKPSEALVKAKTEVLKCLKENDGKPLNCWSEVEAFKKLVNNL